MNYSSRFLSFLLILFFHTSVFAQNALSEISSDVEHLKNLFKNGEYKEVIKLGSKTANDCLQKSDCPKQSAALAFSYTADAFVSMRQIDSSLHYAKQALHLLHKDSLHHQWALGQVYNSLGRAYIRAGQYENAKKWFKQKLSLKFAANSTEYKENLHPAYGNLGLVYDRLGDHHQGIEYLLESIKLKIDLYGDEAYQLASSYNNIGLIYRRMQQIDKSNTYLKKALRLKKKKWGNMHISLMSTYDNLAINYRELKDFDTAMEYISKTKNVLKELYGTEHPAYANIFITQGLTYMEMQDYDKAIEYVKKALEWRAKYGGAKHPKNGVQSVLLGKLYLDKKNYPNAKEYLNKGAKILGYDEKEPIDFTRVTNPSHLINYFKYKQAYYKALYELNDNAAVYKDSILQILDHQLALYDYAESNTILKNDQFLKMERAYYFFEDALYYRLLTDEKEKHIEAFEIVEKSKSRLLFQNFNALRATNFYNVPDSIIAQEKNIEKNIAKIETEKFKISQSRSKAKDSLLASLKTQVLELNMIKEKFEKKIKKQYPNYYNLKNSNNITSLTNIQSTLDNNESLLEYFVGDSSIFIFVIDAENFEVQEIKKDFPLEKWVNDFRTGITDYWTISGQPDTVYQAYALNYTNKAFLLYQKLIKSVEPLLKERVIIVPDGVLHFLPFDALLTKKVNDPTNFRSHPYLLKLHQISYDYSANARVESLKKHSSTTSRNLAAFAPSFPPSPQSNNLQALRNDLYELRYNKAEVEIIESIIPGHIFLEKEALKETFLQNSLDCKIVHLATHGKANNESGDFSFLAFTKIDTSKEKSNLLYARELYNTSINADMVVLSACETGVGELKRGEGMISLARGFTYAGAKSVLSSLWTINDQQSVVFFKLFYQNINNGMQKDEALRQAKLSYLEQSPIPDPYFWSAFVISGDMASIDLNSNRFPWKWIGLTFALIIIFIFYKKLSS